LPTEAKLTITIQERCLKWSWFFGHKKGLFLDRGRH
jgi:hypothetical protein